MAMAQLLRDLKNDNTLSLLSEGYLFIPNRCRRLNKDVFETRLMLQSVICMQGEEAAQIFYDGERFTRQGAMPLTTLMLLQDKGSVQALDGVEHHQRKKMFMSLMGPDSVDRLLEAMTTAWVMKTPDWEESRRIVFHDQVRRILCQAVCEWVGLSLSNSDLDRRTQEMAAMIDGAGGIGPKTWQALLLRQRSEIWARRVIKQVREGRLKVHKESPLAVLAHHRGLNGDVINVKEAGVELLNLIRATVAVARYVVFAALALYEYPTYKERLLSGDVTVEMFTQEVRRFFPFFPFIGGRVVKPFDWRENHFSKGQWVLFDLYGTNHDPRIWQDPEVFRPERFSQWTGDAYRFVPQGAGDHMTTHRCPGEWITIAIINKAVHLLLEAIHYNVPRQNLKVDLSRIPALPRSGFLMNHIERIQ